MKDLKKVSPQRYFLLQELDVVQIEIDLLGVGFGLLTNLEKHAVRTQLQSLYNRKITIKRQLRGIEDGRLLS